MERPQACVFHEVFWSGERLQEEIGLGRQVSFDFYFVKKALAKDLANDGV